MTITITTENVYLGLIFMFMAIQIYQWREIFKLKREAKQIWDQIRVLTINVAAEIMNLKSTETDEKD
jgi:hypothetical protein